MATGTYITIREAAKAVHRSRDYVRGLIESGDLVATRAGGTADHPRLRVTLADLNEAIRRTSIYVPKVDRQKANRPKRPSSAGQLHPVAAAM